MNHKQLRYSIRKSALGVASLLLGATILLAPNVVSAQEVATGTEVTSETVSETPISTGEDTEVATSDMIEVKGHVMIYRYTFPYVSYVIKAVRPDGTEIARQQLGIENNEFSLVFENQEYDIQFELPNGYEIIEYGPTSFELRQTVSIEELGYTFIHPAEVISDDIYVLVKQKLVRPDGSEIPVFYHNNVMVFDSNEKEYEIKFEAPEGYEVNYNSAEDKYYVSKVEPSVSEEAPATEETEAPAEETTKPAEETEAPVEKLETEKTTVKGNISFNPYAEAVDVTVKAVDMNDTLIVSQKVHPVRRIGSFELSFDKQEYKLQFELPDGYKLKEVNADGVYILTTDAAEKEFAEAEVSKENPVEEETEAPAEETTKAAEETTKEQTSVPTTTENTDGEFAVPATAPTLELPILVPNGETDENGAPILVEAPATETTTVEQTETTTSAPKAEVTTVSATQKAEATKAQAQLPSTGEASLLAPAALAIVAGVGLVVSRKREA